MVKEKREWRGQNDDKVVLFVLCLRLFESVHFILLNLCQFLVIELIISYVWLIDLGVYIVPLLNTMCSRNLCVRYNLLCCCYYLLMEDVFCCSSVGHRLSHFKKEWVVHADAQLHLYCGFIAAQFTPTNFQLAPWESWRRHKSSTLSPYDVIENFTRFAMMSLHFILQYKMWSKKVGKEKDFRGKMVWKCIQILRSRITFYCY